MIRRVACTLVSRIPFLPPVTMPTGRRCNTPLSLSTNRHLRMRRRFVAVLPLALLTIGNQCLAQSPSTVSIFTNTVPAVSSISNNKAITLGVKFWSSQSGAISAIRFYRGAKSKSGYVASLYSANGSTKLGSVTMAKESGPVPGWQQAVFAAPIPIAANTTYVAAYFAPSGQYSYTARGLTQTASSAPLSAPAASLVGGNGVSRSNQGFPNSADAKHTNFFVDVAFASPAPYLSIVMNPANPTIPSTAALGSVVAKVNVTWSNGSPFTGTLSFGPPNSNDGGIYALDSNHNLIINPSGPGVGAAGGSVQNVTIVATQ
jgi:hypothetical protein